MGMFAPIFVDHHLLIVITTNLMYDIYIPKKVINVKFKH